MDRYTELINRLNHLVLHDPDNRFTGKVRFFDPPLPGVAAAADPLFAELKKETVAGSLHRSPAEWLPGARSVICYFLPFSPEIRRANYGRAIAADWLHARFRGEKFNNKIRRFIVGLLAEWGERSVAPMLEEIFFIDSGRFRSNWSERHAAYIAGLGTFGLSRSLITAKGAAGRFGSVVTTMELQPGNRAYTQVYQFCPWMADRSCGACIDRCPVGAISVEGKDKGVCSSNLLGRSAGAVREQYGYPYLACGKCQTGIPCEERIP